MGIKPTTLKELKEAWLKAKIKAGDFRGLGNARFKFATTHAAALSVIYYSIAPNEGKRNELEMNIDNESYCWTWEQLVKEVKEHTDKELKINFTVNIWNKQRTDAERKDIDSFTFYKTK